MTTDSLKIIDKVFKLKMVFIDQNALFGKTAEYFILKLKKNALESWNALASHGILVHCQLQRLFVESRNKFRSWKLFSKKFHAFVTLFTHRHLGHVFSSCMVDINAKIDLRFPFLALQLYWNQTSAWVFPCKLAAYFQNTFS